MHDGAAAAERAGSKTAPSQVLKEERVRMGCWLDGRPNDSGLSAVLSIGAILLSIGDSTDEERALQWNESAALSHPVIDTQPIPQAHVVWRSGSRRSC